MDANMDNTADFLFYAGHDGKIHVQIVVGNETVWTTEAGMAQIFEVDRSGINRHITNIFSEGEVIEDSSVQKVHITNSAKPVLFYNLDVIIAVGYRVNSYKATQFRIWATKILKEFLIKGFALDDERLKQGKKMFEKDYFDELLERIREIRSSERRFYQKITDIYAQCSIDYNKDSVVTQTFFATVQNKLEYAITHHTAAEIIKGRASSKEPNMGLTSWKNEPSAGKVLKSDVIIAKNYLKEDEIDGLNRIVNMFLDYAENLAKRHIALKMSDWVERLDGFLKFNEYDLLYDSGKVSKLAAQKFAEKEYTKFRIIQDRNFESDFDRRLGNIKQLKDVPKEDKIDAMIKSNKSKFDEFLKGIIKVPPPPKRKKPE